MTIKSKHIYFFIKINFFISLLIWFISRINLYFITKNNDKLIFLNSNAIIYTIILFLILFYVKKTNKIVFIFSLISAIYIINTGILFNLILPFCSNDISMTPIELVITLMLVIIISLLTIRINYYLKMKINYFYTPVILAILHFIAITFTFYFNYINLYESIFGFVKQ